MIKELKDLLPTETDTATPQPAWLHLWLIYLGLSALAVFAVLPESYEKMLDWPWLLVWQGGFFSIGIWFLLSLRQYQQPWYRLGYGLDFGVMGLGLTLILSTLNAASVQAAGWYLVMVLGHYVLLYSVCNWLRQPAQWEKLWGYLSITAGASACVSLGLWWSTADWLGLQNDLPLGQAGFVAGYLVLSLPIVVAYGIAYRGWRRLLGGCACVVLLLDLYSTAFRPALVAIALVGVLSYLMMLVSLRRRFSFKKIIGGTALLMLVLFAAIFNPSFLATAAVKSLELNSIAQSSFIDVIQERLLLWTTSLGILQAHPLHGLGMGNLGRQWEQFQPLIGSVPPTPHLFSTPLQLLSELGLLGAIASFVALFLVIRLWLSVLPYVAENSKAEVLIYGIGASWLGYGIVCLTDYQLENLAISTTLVLTLGLLLGIAHQFSPEAVRPHTPRQRRAMQLVSLWVLVIALYAGLPRTLATASAAQGQADKRQGNLAGYEQKLRRAHKLIPWQQSYAADLGMTAWQQEKATTENSQQLQGSSATYFRWAAEAIPEDALLQYNYGAIAASESPAEAIPVFEQLVRTQPVTFPYSHYLLAKSYLQRPDIPYGKVLELLALQILQQPEFVTAPQWQSDPDLRPLRNEVYQKAIAHYRTLIEAQSPADARADKLYEQMILVQWWRQDFLGQVIPNKLRPIVQAVIFAESQPQLSLGIINQALIQTPDDVPLQVLKTWFEPTFQFTTETADGSALVIKNPSSTYATLQAWLRGTIPAQPIAAIATNSHSQRYREPDLAELSYILPPKNLQELPMLEVLQLFSDNNANPKFESLFLKIQQKNLRN
ncbi:MAG: O-antigen ligase family protein [Limnothrix sp.]